MDFPSIVCFNRTIKTLENVYEPIGTIPPQCVDQDFLPNAFYEIHTEPSSSIVKEQLDSINQFISTCSGYKTSPCNMDNVQTKCIIGLDDGTIVKELNEDTVKVLLSHASVAKFGDIQQQTTRIDKRVRKAKVIENFTLNTDFIDEVTDTWRKHFLHQNVTVEPSKINIYNFDDFFAEHRDTPSGNLVGSIVVSIYNNADMRPNHLAGLYVTTGIRQGKWDFQHKDEIHFDESKYNWIGFYPDCPHKVTGGVSESFYRINITFKVFAQVEPLKIINESGSGDALRSCLSKAPFSLILTHDYSFTTGNHALKGIDLLLYEYIKQFKDIDIQCIPVIYKIYANADLADRDDEDEGENIQPVGNLEVKVFPLTDDVISECNRRFTIQSKEQKIQYKDKMNFYFLKPGSYGECLKQSSDTTGYSGNEYEAGASQEVDFTYLSRAFILNYNIDRIDIIKENISNVRMMDVENIGNMIDDFIVEDNNVKMVTNLFADINE